ncbi:hypothetical protein TNCT_526751 [Trichonephila clavata]|uniref:Uncharacterized protein n=1 Tax=Trichonephila clavata TaxID=2740835 RepID=A0A8X6L246_TRICU|nr:hypothetical protein TNCT_214641 [Trichonephila clavata]GFQ87428.1 hypothetical protein TNCT_652601 [Trichonephila clavata]GFQ92641.1 hypothetical protein TNCT_526751 [Trichonephila clavata]
MFNCCSHGTLLRASVFEVLTRIFATTTKICTGGGSSRVHALTFYALRRDPPTPFSVSETLEKGPGSPTETLLRLLPPLSGQVRSSSRHVDSTPERSPERWSEDLTPPLNRR